MSRGSCTLYIRTGNGPRYNHETGKENPDGYLFYPVLDLKQEPDESYKEFDKRISREKKKIEEQYLLKSKD